jgi:prepilin-type processing-associated H-X9-DG protein
MYIGGGAALDKAEGAGLQSLADPANTLMVVEAAEAVPWTEPEGLLYDPDQPLPPLGGAFDDGFHALFADGSVRFIPHTTDEQVIRAYITGRTP